ncbi:IS66 family transposase zinc-finger binding domain-containing protein [Acidithiobacillus sp.]|uniref:IS66 family transposase zinc-finger binding domain-containing protein n=1 Tax=Acidithiobacillus sp. TaxID=1872118 RepID=UPI003D00820E
MTQLSEERAEQLEQVSARFRVIRHIRSKYARRHCQTLIIPPMPARAIAVCPRKR